MIKGIMDAEDVARAVEEGADGIFVSNHGGRQFDSQPATIDVLPSIVDAVGGRAEIYLDGGIRRGHDIVKAVTLGAKAAVADGRSPTPWPPAGSRPWTGCSGSCRRSSRAPWASLEVLGCGPGRQHLCCASPARVR